MNHGGAFLIKQYSGAPHRLLAETFPGSNFPHNNDKEKPWEIWRFSRVPEGYWDDPTNLKEAFDIFAKKIGVKKLDDWYQVTALQITQFGFSSRISTPK